MNLKYLFIGLLWGLLCWASLPAVKYLIAKSWDPSNYNIISLLIWLLGGIVFGFFFKKMSTRQGKKRK